MPQIFISYSRKDSTVAEHIIMRLANTNKDNDDDNNIEPWVDWKKIPKGEEFWREIQLGIEGSDIFIFLVSPDSAQSDWCNREIEHAVKNGKRILPIVIRETDLEMIHPEVSNRNWIFFREGRDDFETAINETRKTILTDYAWVKYHTQLQVKAIDWEKKKDNGLLLRGKTLREAEELLASVNKDPLPTELHRLFLLRSQRFAKKVQMLFTVIAIIGLTIFALLSVFAWSQRNSAIHRRIVGLSYQLSAQAKEIMHDDYQLAVLLATQAFQFQDTPDTRLALDQVLQIEPRIQMSVKDNDFFAIGSGIAFSPDGSITAVAVGSANQIYLYDAENGTLLNIYDTYPFAPRMLAFSPDNRYLIAGEFSPTRYAAEEADLMILDIKKDKKTFYSMYEKGVTALAFGPDPELLAISGDGVIRLLNITSGKVTKELQAHTGLIFSLAFDKSGKYLASAGSDVIVWDLQDDNGIALPGNDGYANSVAFSPDGSHIYAISLSLKYRIEDIISEYYVYSWNLKDKSLVASNTITAAVNAPNIFATSGQVIVINSGKIILLDPDTLQENSNQINIEHQASGVWTQTTNTGKFVTLGESGQLTFYDLDIRKRFIEELPIYTESAPRELVVDMAWSADGKYFITSGRGYKSADVIVWDAESKKIKHILPVKSGLVATDRNGKFIATVQENNIVLWDATTFEPTDIKFEVDDLVISVKFSPDSETMAVGTEGGKLILYNIETMSVIARDEMTLGNSYGQIEYLSSDSLVFSSGKILQKLSGINSGDILVEPLGISGAQDDWKLSPDGNVLTVIRQSYEGGDLLEVWNINELELISRSFYREPRFPILSLAMDGNGEQLITVSCYDQNAQSLMKCHPTKARLWDSFKGLTSGELSINDYFIINPIFTSDNEIVFSADSGKLLFWNTDIGERLETACNLAGRNLSFSEWQRYIGSDLEYQKTCNKYPTGPDTLSLPQEKSDVVQHKELTIEFLDQPTNTAITQMYILPERSSDVLAIPNLQHIHPALIMENSSENIIEGNVEVMLLTSERNMVNRYRFPIKLFPGSNLLTPPRALSVMNEKVDAIQLVFQDVQYTNYDAASTVASDNLSNENMVLLGQNGRPYLSINVEGVFQDDVKLLEAKGVIVSDNQIMDFLIMKGETAINQAVPSKLEFFLKGDCIQTPDCYNKNSAYQILFWVTTQKAGDIATQHHFKLDLPSSVVSSYSANGNNNGIPNIIFESSTSLEQIDFGNPNIQKNIDNKLLSVFDLDNKMVVGVPYLLQCRDAKESSQLVEDYFLALPVKLADGGWGEASGELFLLSNDKLVDRKAIDFHVTGNDYSVLLSSKDGYIVGGTDDVITDFIFVVNDWQIKQESKITGKLRIDLLGSRNYGWVEYNQHTFLLKVKNKTDKSLSNIKIWGVVKNALGVPVDIVTEWQGYFPSNSQGTYFRNEPLLPEYTNFYQLVSISNTGRCVGDSNNSGPYSLELFIETDTEDETKYFINEELDIPGQNTNGIIFP